jgi:hypothetical protein
MNTSKLVAYATIAGGFAAAIYYLTQIGVGKNNSLQNSISGGSNAEASTHGQTGTPYYGYTRISDMPPSGDLLDENSSNAAQFVNGFHADVFNPIPNSPTAGSIPTSNQVGEVSGSIQSWSARPYQNGNNAAYMDSYLGSPPDPVYTANVLTNDPTQSLDLDD